MTIDALKQLQKRTFQEQERHWAECFPELYRLKLRFEREHNEGSSCVPKPSPKGLSSKD